MRGWRLGSRTATSHPPGSGRGGSIPRGRGRARLVAKGGEVGGFGHCGPGSLRRLSSPSDPKGSPKQAYRVRRRHSRQCVGWNGADAPRKSLQRGRLSGCGSSRKVETAPTCSIRLYLHVRTCACTRTCTCTCTCTCCAVCSAVQAVACAVCMRCTYTLYTAAPSPAAPEGEMAPPATPRAAESQLGMQRDAVTAAAAAVTAAAAAVGGWPVIAPRAHRQHGRR